MSPSRPATYLLLLFLSPAFATPAARAAQGPVIPEEIINLRDPFKRPPVTARTSKSAAARFDLESYELESFKLVGVLTGPERLKAMVQAPDGKTFFVSEKMLMGTKKGVVRRITPEAIYIREKSVNILGQEENLDVEIRMPTSAGENFVTTELTTSPGGRPPAAAPPSSPNHQPTTLEDPGGRH